MLRIINPNKDSLLLVIKTWVMFYWYNIPKAQMKSFLWWLLQWKMTLMPLMKKSAVHWDSCSSMFHDFHWTNGGGRTLTTNHLDKLYTIIPYPEIWTKGILGGGITLLNHHLVRWPRRFGRYNLPRTIGYFLYKCIFICKQNGFLVGSLKGSRHFFSSNVFASCSPPNLYHHITSDWTWVCRCNRGAWGPLNVPGLS